MSKCSEHRKVVGLAAGLDLERDNIILLSDDKPISSRIAKSMDEAGIEFIESHISGDDEERPVILVSKQSKIRRYSEPLGISNMIRRHSTEGGLFAHG